LANRLLRNDHAPELTIGLTESNLELQIALFKTLQAFVQAPWDANSLTA
jgi:hypothetical protein